MSNSYSGAKRYGFSWRWDLGHDWGIWLRRDAPDLFAWRFNIGPLHIVRLR